MSELTGLLEQLASKLGTTTEYLWNILLVQAKVSAIINLMYLLLMLVSGFVLYKCHMNFSKKNDKAYNKYDDMEEAIVIPMIILTSCWLIAFIVCFFSIGDIINGFFNPEYWALNKILQTVK